MKSYIDTRHVHSVANNNIYEIFSAAILSKQDFAIEHFYDKSIGTINTKQSLSSYSQLWKPQDTQEKHHLLNRLFFHKIFRTSFWSTKKRHNGKR